jgi:hypothetical protein
LDSNLSPEKILNFADSLYSLDGISEMSALDLLDLSNEILSEAEAAGIASEDVLAYAQNLQNTEDFANESAEAVLRFALAQKKVDAGLELGGKYLQDYQNALNNNEKNTEKVLAA